MQNLSIYFSIIKSLINREMALGAPNWSNYVIKRFALLLICSVVAAIFIILGSASVFIKLLEKTAPELSYYGLFNSACVTQRLSRDVCSLV